MYALVPSPPAAITAAALALTTAAALVAAAAIAPAALAALAATSFAIAFAAAKLPRRELLSCDADDTDMGE